MEMTGFFFNPLFQDFSEPFVLVFRLTSQRSEVPTRESTSET